MDATGLISYGGIKSTSSIDLATVQREFKIEFVSSDNLMEYFTPRRTGKPHLECKSNQSCD